MASLNPIGTESRVEGIPALSFAANWTLTRDGIYFYPADDFSTLSYFDFATRKVHPVLKGQIVFFGIAVSPDGRYIVYSQHHIPKRDIMLIDNFRYAPFEHLHNCQFLTSFENPVWYIVPETHAVRCKVARIIAFRALG